jgi:hypothetical protein
MTTVTPGAVEVTACPFCGSTAYVESESCGYRVVCDNKECATQGPWPTDCTEAEAITAWNTRATPPALQTVVEALMHVTNCLVEELGNLANENETEDEDLAAILGQEYARQIIACRLRIRQARAALSLAGGDV